jgi:hypothetical protein
LNEILEAGSSGYGFDEANYYIYDIGRTLYAIFQLLIPTEGFGRIIMVPRGYITINRFLEANKLRVGQAYTISINSLLINTTIRIIDGRIVDE